MGLQPGDYNDKKWSDPPQFELVDQTLPIVPGAELCLIDQQFGEGPEVIARVVEIRPADARAHQELVVDTPLGRLALTRRYGWTGELPGRSVTLRSGRSEVNATELASGSVRKVQIVVASADGP